MKVLSHKTILLFSNKQLVGSTKCSGRIVNYHRTQTFSSIIIMILMSYHTTITVSFFVLFSVECFPSLRFPPLISGQVFWAAHRENLTWSWWPTGSSASALLHGILGPCSSCVPIREPWLMWPVLAFHLGSPAPHLAPVVWWSTTNCHRLGPLGWDCPPIPLIDFWPSRSAQVSPHTLAQT